ncbi:MAG: YgiT-type zinc finger protein [Caldilineaceae bacterium]|nr:YgiT-type zinc finger protein [Caldilineaceae bacterium]MBP8124508.1 YgiT-type zinc finger protein [Caldilineaceae bacterium]
MSDKNETTGFWSGEICDQCGGPIVEKQVTLHRQIQGKYFLFEHVPAGVCQSCGMRFYAANTLKRIEESLRGQQKAEREVLVPVYSM